MESGKPVMCGGSMPHAVDDRVVEITQKMKPLVEKKYETTFSTFKPVACLSQVVAGLNYFVKVETDKGTYHLRVYDRFGDLQLTDVKEATAEEDLIYFYHPLFNKQL
ncbi:uncharacterized protein [Blastocystis hominis]|uniref:Cystatin domain-containing protein n=1 Tax=Blastocystis hominis TaxID=12968 RepID=D8LVD4_BLAHO|nr:uncharacterized protein [Blastocystis hominis]CBK19773.2 unnamed protein product [Blastocystis hominis]|eukprot:XP_012893821.1 uncharacterized protein [Blastocystis hominis]